MGTMLMNLESKIRDKKLGEGRPLDGRKRLTDIWILKIQKYYGLVIMRNIGSLEDMEKVVWAESFNLFSTDENPQHTLCPRGEASWCNYRGAEALSQTYKHSDYSHLPLIVVTQMKPIFRDQANLELLKKCVNGQCRNSNESLDNVIWNHPKHSSPSEPFTWAIARFNMGNIVKVMVLSKLGLHPGSRCITAMQQQGTARLKKS
ncbi:hypothetical protein PR048_005070 [Dryococelus australis]|uniref:Uncharacterized protein n=1 Tax=Dryococelus australis TaxID=614101 RepID=A0ABQ9I777_9NEOP|nr:hypothetical protein PR048_005070 [Dryococelus australis]